jgi:hypothetical protein
MNTGDKATRGYSIFCAKIIVKQTGTITKTESTFLLVNAYIYPGTGLQNFDQYYDPANWSDVTDNWYHEIGTKDSTYTLTAKLQSDPNGTPADIANSSVSDGGSSGARLDRGASAMTMPGTAKEIDTYIVTNTAGMTLSRMVVVVVTGGGATYYESVTLPAYGAITVSPKVDFNTSIQLSVSADDGLGTGGSIQYVSHTLAAYASQVEAALADIMEALTLPGAAGITLEAGLEFSESETLQAVAALVSTVLADLYETISLGANAAMAETAVATVLSSLGLSAQAALTLAAQLTLTGTLSLGVVAGISPTGNLIIDGGADLEAQAGLATEGAKGFADQISLDSNGALSASALVDYLVSLGLGAGAAMPVAIQIIAYNAVEMAAMAGLTGVGEAAYYESLTLPAAGQLTVAGLVEYLLGLGLPVNAALQVATLYMTYATVDLPALAGLNLVGEISGVGEAGPQYLSTLAARLFYPGNLDQKAKPNQLNRTGAQRIA